MKHGALSTIILTALFYSNQAMTQPSPEPEGTKNEPSSAIYKPLDGSETTDLMLYQYQLFSSTTFPAAPAYFWHTTVEQPDSWTIPIVHSLALLTTMRIAEAVIWPEPFAETNLEIIGERYREAFTEPPKYDPNVHFLISDGDPWYVNAIGHPLFGSEMYTRARICNRNQLESLAFTIAGSTIWEYGFEASGVRPSALDLVFTPLSGWILGEGRYQLWKAASGIESKGWRIFTSSLVDPFGELERAIGTDC